MKEGSGLLKASGRLITTCQGFQWEREAPAELGLGSAGASPTRFKQYCRSANGENRIEVQVTTGRDNGPVILYRRVNN